MNATSKLDLIKDHDLQIAEICLSGDDSLTQAAAAIEQALACAHERGEERAVRILHAMMALIAPTRSH